MIKEVRPKAAADSLTCWYTAYEIKLVLAVVSGDIFSLACVEIHNRPSSQIDD